MTLLRHLIVTPLYVAGLAGAALTASGLLLVIAAGHVLDRLDR